MADVGVLSLEIQADSSAATRSMGKLVSALQQIKSAVDNAAGLRSVASALKRINDSVNGSTISNLNGVASALERVKAACDFKVPDMSGLGKLKRYMDSINNGASSLNKMRDVASSMSTDSVESFDRMTDGVQRHAQTVRDLSTEYTKAWQTISSIDFSALDGFRLGEGASILNLGPGGVAPENMLSTQVWTGPNWSPDWTDGSNFTTSFQMVQQTYEDTVEAIGIVTDELGNIVGRVGTAASSIGEFTGVLEESAAEWGEYASHAQDASTAVGGFSEAVQEAQGLMANMNWTTGQDMFEQFASMLNSMLRYKSSMALGPGTQLSTDVNMGWTYWKNGAIAAEGTVTDAMDSIYTRIEGTSNLLLGAGQQIQDTLEDTERNVSGYRVFDPKTGDFTKPLDEFTREVIAARGAAESVREPVQQVAQAASSIDGTGMRNMADGLSQVGNAADAVGELPQQLQAATDAAGGLPAALDASATSGITLRGIVEGLTGSLRGLRNAIQHSALGNLATQMFRIARYRMLRSIIKNIADGIKEGFSNYKNYSNTVGNKFSKELAGVNAQVAQMKNSFGAAIAPALSAAIPILQGIASAATSACNAVNQLITLLTGGSSWSRATNNVGTTKGLLSGASDAASDMKDSVDQAKKSTKDLLADWDELNIIQSSSGGGGGGGGTDNLADALSMFEEVMNFDPTIRLFADTLLDQFGDIWNLVERIGAALLAWRLSTALTGVLGSLAAWAASGLIIGLTFDIVQVFDKMYLNTGDAGWLIGDVLTTLLGATLASRVVGSMLNGGAGHLVFSLTLAVSAIASVIANIQNTDVSALSKESILTNVLAALKMGAGAAYLAHTLMGVNLGTSIKGGFAVAIATFGVALGVKATVQAVESGVTMDTIKSVAIASLAVGLGAGLMGAVLHAGLMGSLALGGMAAGATVAVIAASIGIAAVLKSVGQTEWGDYEATEAEIQAFVEAKAFTVDVPVVTKLIGDNTTKTNATRESIETQLTTALGEFNVIKLGLAKDDDYADLNNQINGEGGLISKIGEYIETAKATGKLTLQFTPSLVGEDNEDASSWFESYTTGWDKVNSFMTAKGAELGALLTMSEAERIRAGGTEVIAALMEQISNVTNAITKAEISSKAFGNLSFNFSGLEDLSKASVEEVAKMFATYKSELQQSYTQLVNEQFVKQGQLVAALFEIDPESQEYKDALATYEWMADHLAEIVEKEVDKASEPGRELFTEFLKTRFGDFNKTLEERIDIYDLFNFSDVSFGDSDREIANGVRAMVDNALGYVNSDLQQLVQQSGTDSWSLLTDDVRLRILQSMGEVYDTETIARVAKLLGGGLDEALLASTEEALGDNSPVEVVNETLENTGTVEIDHSATDASVEEMATVADEAAAETKTAIESVNGLSTGAVDTSATIGSMASAAAQAWEYARSIQAAAIAANGAGYGGGWGNTRLGGVSGRPSSFMPTYATGGFPDSGSIFMADENGNIELKGKMGNQPVVANNQQIIAGISEGVTKAQSEQNSLLARQNELLMQILHKSGNAVVTASSQIGRVNARSNRMYERVTGG